MAQRQFRVLDPLPHRVKWVRLAGGGGKDGLSIVECSHPMEERREVLRGARAAVFCSLCRAEDMNRSCLTLAIVPEEARVPGSPRTPEQGALF